MDPDQSPGVPGWDRLFVECDSQGEILWMNERARARLGPARNFLDAVPSAQASEAWQLLRGGNADDEPAMTCMFGASKGVSAVPVHFVRLFATERKVVLAAQVRSRASDAGTSGEALALLREVQRTIALLLAPFAPYLAHELWEMLGEQGSLLRAPWPKYDPALAKEDEIEIPVQINGKLRGRIVVPADASEDLVRTNAQSDEKIASMIAGKQIVKVIVVPGKLINIVVK